MNNIRNIENKETYFKKNKTEIKKIKNIQTEMSFKNHLRKEEIICHCFSVKEKDLSNFQSFEDLVKKTGASTRCTACFKDINNYYQ